MDELKDTLWRNSIFASEVAETFASFKTLANKPVSLFD
jgi:hypothetical protein